MAETEMGRSGEIRILPSALLEDIEKRAIYVTEEDGDIHGAFRLYR